MRRRCTEQGVAEHPETRVGSLSCSLACQTMHTFARPGRFRAHRQRRPTSRQDRSKLNRGQSRVAEGARWPRQGDTASLGASSLPRTSPPEHRFGADIGVHNRHARANRGSRTITLSRHRTALRLGEERSHTQKRFAVEKAKDGARGMTLSARYLPGPGPTLDVEGEVSRSAWPKCAWRIERR